MNRPPPGAALSVATRGGGTQNLLCAYLAAAVLVGLLGNAVLGLWWLDPCRRPRRRRGRGQGGARELARGGLLFGMLMQDTRGRLRERNHEAMPT